MFAPRSYHKGQDPVKMDDFESLFYSGMDLTANKLPWNREDIKMDQYLYYKQSKKLMQVSKCKSNEFNSIIQPFFKEYCERIKPLDARNAFLYFYNEVTSDKTVPRYDNLYNYIKDAICNITGTRTPYFSWLTPLELSPPPQDKRYKIAEPMKDLEPRAMQAEHGQFRYVPPRRNPMKDLEPRAMEAERGQVRYVAAPRNGRIQGGRV